MSSARAEVQSRRFLAFTRADLPALPRTVKGIALVIQDEASTFDPCAQLLAGMAMLGVAQQRAASAWFHTDPFRASLVPLDCYVVQGAGRAAGNSRREALLVHTTRSIGIDASPPTFKVSVDAEKLLEFHGALDAEGFSDHAVGDL